MSELPLRAAGARSKRKSRAAFFRMAIFSLRDVTLNGRRVLGGYPVDR
jgi:hypothetical protein